MIAAADGKSNKDAHIEAFTNGLKSRNEETRLNTARELQRYVSNELQEANIEDVAAFLDTFSKHILEMIASNDVNEKKGGVLAISIIVGVDTGNRSTLCSRFANYLRSQTPSDVDLMELTAYAIGKVAEASGQLTAHYVEYEAKRAIEWLSSIEKSENKRHAAVSQGLVSFGPNSGLYSYQFCVSWRWRRRRSSFSKCHSSSR